ncbi:MAG: alpha/beta hydrolase [Polyangiales bacterium]
MTTARFEDYDWHGLHYLRRPAERDDAPVLHFTHATGFHAATYRPLLERVPRNLDVHAVDLRGHGESHALGDVSRFDSWQCYVDDLLSWLDARAAPVLLAGHSVGGTVSLLAAAARPDKVAGLLLLEPVIPAWYTRPFVALMQRLGQMHRHPLALGAARRKNDFRDAAEALSRYEGRGAFATWPREFLEAYVAGAFLPESSPTPGVRLACAPAWEARSFALTPRDPLRGVPAFGCPVTLMVGERGSTCRPSSCRELVCKLPQTRVVHITGASHFLPMEHAERVVPELARIRLTVAASSHG